MNTVSMMKTLLADVVCLQSLALMDVEELFPHVLPMPISCPCCGTEWAVFLSQEGMAAETKVYRDNYLLLLAGAIGRDCPQMQEVSEDDALSQHAIEWYRTDGRAVWVEIPKKLRMALEALDALDISACVC